MKGGVVGEEDGDGNGDGEDSDLNCRRTDALSMIEEVKVLLRCSGARLEGVFWHHVSRSLLYC